MKILVTPTSLQPGKDSQALDLLYDFSSDLVFNTYGRPLNEAELIPLLKDCDGYIAGLDSVTETVLNSCPNLKAISRYGAGYDRVDIKSAKKKGIIVTNTPGANATAVAELAFALILSLARNIPYLDSTTRSGKWVRSTGMELKGKTLGIMGLGAIGKTVAGFAKGFHMDIIAYDPFIDKEYCKLNQIQAGTFEEVCKKSNVISLHLPLTDATWHLISQEAISMMQDNTLLINTSRGGIIDEAAAFQALTTGKLGGMGLDAFEQEPPKASPLFKLDNVIVTPHTGAHTKEAGINMAEAAVRNLIDVLSKKDCPFVINA